MDITLKTPELMIPPNTFWEIGQGLRKVICSTRAVNGELEALQQEVMDSLQPIEPEEKFIARVEQFKRAVMGNQAIVSNFSLIGKVVFFHQIWTLKRLLRKVISNANLLIIYIKERNADFSPISGKGPFYDFESFWKAVNSEDN